MIKAEVVFDGSTIIFGNYSIFDNGDLDPLYRVILGSDLIGEFATLEEAIKYCLEN